MKSHSKRIRHIRRFTARLVCHRLTCLVVSKHVVLTRSRRTVEYPLLDDLWCNLRPHLDLDQSSIAVVLTEDTNFNTSSNLNISPESTPTEETDCRTIVEAVSTLRCVCSTSIWCGPQGKGGGGLKRGAPESKGNSVLRLHSKYSWGIIYIHSLEREGVTGPLVIVSIFVYH